MNKDDVERSWRAAEQDKFGASVSPWSNVLRGSKRQEAVGIRNIMYWSST